MLAHFTRTVRDVVDRLNFKKFASTCSLYRSNICVAKTRAVTSNYGSSFQCLKHIGAPNENSGVKSDSDETFGRNQNESWTDSVHLEHSALGLLGWSTALAIGWCVSQPFFRKCILPAEGNKWDEAPISHSLTKIVFTQPSVGISKTNNCLNHSVTETVNARPDVGMNEKSNFLTQTVSHNLENSNHDPQTPEEALKKAADNLGKVQNALAAAVDNKLGVKHVKSGKNKTAATNFLKAAELGNRTSMFNMGICYEMGLGVKKDLNQAARYYRMAAEKGHATAIYNLGVYHMYGLGGVVKDTSYAQELFKCAAFLGQSEAKEAYNKLSLYLEKRNKVQQSTNEPVIGLNNLQVSGAANEPSTLLKDGVSSDTLSYKVKLTSVLAPNRNSKESWTRDFIKLVSYIQKPR